MFSLANVEVEQMSEGGHCPVDIVWRPDSRRSISEILFGSAVFALRCRETCICREWAREVFFLDFLIRVSMSRTWIGDSTLDRKLGSFNGDGVFALEKKDG